MILGLGGLINFIVYYVLGNRDYNDFAIFIGIGFLMTLARFISMVSISGIHHLKSQVIKYLFYS